MSIEKNRKGGRKIYFLPLIAAAPTAAAIAFVILRFGPKIQKLINILMKLVVKS